MSLIAEFGLCSSDKYRKLFYYMRQGDVNNISLVIQEIQEELEMYKLPPSECSAEVFIGIFLYLEQKLGIDLHNYEGATFGEAWREVTGDLDVLIWDDKLKNKCLFTLNSEKLDYEELCEFIYYLYGIDFRAKIQNLIRYFESNLEKIIKGTVMIYRLY